MLKEITALEIPQNKNKFMAHNNKKRSQCSA